MKKDYFYKLYITRTSSSFEKHHTLCKEKFKLGTNVEN